MAHTTELDLFGGGKRWSSTDWIASDDQVRGGKSKSYLDCCSSTATFNGTLDTRTLGGAGFASQRTTTTKKVWNLKPYDAIKIAISNPSRSQSFSQPITPPEKYTFIVKDTLPDKRPDGRDEATINYEYDFKVDQGSEDSEEEIEIIIPWSRFQPMYRGKPKKDANKLDTKSIRRFSIMMRSFFGEQEGEFSLTIKKISAVRFSEDRESWDFCD